MAAGTAGFVLADRGEERRPAGASATASPSPVTAVREPVAVPAGWSTFTEPAEGWSIGVPPGFAQSTYRGTQVQLRDPRTRRTLRVDWTGDAGPSAVEAWRAFSPQLAQVLSGYQQQRLEEVDFQGLDAADLEFTYTDSGADLRVLDRRIVAKDGGQAVALYWQTRAADFPASLEVFEQMASTFRFG